MIPELEQSPREDSFVQDPYPFYARARAAGPLVRWADYDMPCATDHATVAAILRDRRFGREVPAARRVPVPEHLAPFAALEAHSLLELEPPAHTRLRGLVTRAFTSARVAALEPQIAALAHALVDRFEGPRVELLAAFAEPMPATVIARLMGLPDADVPSLLRWSHAMVAMYQARRDHAVEEAAGAAARDFAAYLSAAIAERRRAPRDDLLSELVAVRDAGERLGEAEMISTVVLLLNAGHEATVHAIGNGVRACLAHGHRPTPASSEALAEEILRFDPPLHLFTRYAKEPVEIAGHRFAEGDEVGLLLASANRDAGVYTAPDAFCPDRFALRPAPPTHAALGAGLHFCIGAPLARAELRIALPLLFERHPSLAPDGPARFADRYHFHGLERLPLTLCA